MKRENVIGNKYGRLTVLEDAPDKIYRNGAHDRVEKCICECGKIKFVKLGELKSGRTKSCGCYHDEACKNRATSHGMANTRLYRIWCLMKTRCSNPSAQYYYLYGGKGIKVCDEWKDNFEEFCNWSILSGYNDSLTIDRIDSNKDYCPNNCRWVTFEVQANNTSRNRIIEYNGKKYTMSEFSKNFNFPYNTLKARLRLGMDIEDILSKPIKKVNYKGCEENKYITINGVKLSPSQWCEKLGLGEFTINKWLRKYTNECIIKLIIAMLNDPISNHVRKKETWFHVYGIEPELR